MWFDGKAGAIGTAKVCSDEDFLRRVYLDLWGTIPTADQARDFLARLDLEMLLETVEVAPEAVDPFAAVELIESTLSGNDSNAHGGALLLFNASTGLVVNSTVSYPCASRYATRF